MEHPTPDSHSPVVEHFKIIGLHGYKDISLNFGGRARIAIAENGSGKTTFLSALNAFLQADFEKFRSLAFRSIECKFWGHSRTLTLQKSQLPQATSNNSIARLSADLAKYSPRAQHSEIRRLVLSFNPKNFEADVANSRVFQDIYQKSPWSRTDVATRARKLRTALEDLRTEELDALSSAIQSAMGPIQVLYLPTYRRVELPVAKPAAERAAMQHNLLYQLDLELPDPRAKEDELGIQYGLADVDARLIELLTEIQRLSTQGYRSTSANIIDELLQVGEIKGPASSSLPSVEALSLFLSRIDQSPAKPAQRLNSIKALYESGAIDSESNNLLRYFLGKLSAAVDRTRYLEASIEQFVERVNVYLESSSDEKRLEYDASRMKVAVKNLWTGNDVKLDDLSSGEKQVISLLAHFYLNFEKKILLIDEPELSLSINWQKRLLPDVLASPTCAQLLAITHSPFIFDNALDPFAGPLEIERSKSSAQ